jgi:hypothetical protein
MKRSLLLSLSLALLVSLSGTALAQFPKLPKIPLPEQIPDVSQLVEEKPPVTTGLPDAVTEVPFLDDFNPRVFAPMNELPRGPNAAFFLAPGLFEFYAQSYCLHAGTHAPGGGDGYLYAPLAGPEAGSVQTILRNSVAHPDIDQHDIQLLLP